jgi:hypothetical protein
MNRIHRHRLVPVATAATLLLAACGGGGGDDGPQFVTGTDVPVTATATSQEATSFVRSTASSSNSGEPLALGNADLATSETAEPDPNV